MTDHAIVVAGFGRCGSSLVMQMLTAAGVQTTGQYPSFEDDRITSFEVSQLFPDAWIGKAVKVLDPHRHDFDWSPCRVIWLDRNPTEQAKSLSKFGHIMGGLPPYTRAGLKGLAKALQRDRRTAVERIKKSGAPLLQLRFEDLLARPKLSAELIAAFVGGLDPEVMARVVRDRSPACYDGLLELTLFSESQKEELS